jgi:hypothetical protein
LVGVALGHAGENVLLLIVPVIPIRVDVGFPCDAGSARGNDGWVLPRSPSNVAVHLPTSLA